MGRSRSEEGGGKAFLLSNQFSDLLAVAVVSLDAADAVPLDQIHHSQLDSREFSFSIPKLLLLLLLPVKLNLILGLCCSCPV